MDKQKIIEELKKNEWFAFGGLGAEHRQVLEENMKSVEQRGVERVV